MEKDKEKIDRKVFVTKGKRVELEEEEEEEKETFVDYFYDEPGTSPGTLIIEEDAPHPRLILINYNKEKENTTELKSPDEYKEFFEKKTVDWLDIQGLGSEEILRKIGDIFHLHPLMLEDVVNVPQRAKIDEYENQLLIITQMVRLDKNKDDELVREQVSFVLGENYLLTFQEEPYVDTFEPVRERIRMNKGTIRKRGPDYLAYALIDSIVDGYYPVLESYGEEIEELENKVVTKPTRRTLERIHYLKRELLQVRRFIWPMREVINSLIRDESNLIGKDVRIYLKDCYDHTIQVMDMMETYRELAYSIMDVYMSSVSNKMNDIMKLLTIISSIFIPLNFIAGIYGMNFQTDKPFNMPELNWSFGYIYCLMLMLFIAVSMIIAFWHKGWFEKFSSIKDEDD